MSDDREPSRFIVCTHCGAQCPCSADTLRRYAGRTVTRWCGTCNKLFDVLLPLQESVDDDR